MKILYLTPGCFDKGGISRYSRYQITALRELYGNDAVKVLSLLGPDKDSFENDFEVEWYAGGNGPAQKIQYLLKFARLLFSWKPDIVHVAHVNFSGFVYALAKWKKAKVVLNVYGLEVWSGLSRDAAYGLKKVHRVISDCHYTAQYLEENGLRPAGSTDVIWDCVDLDRFQPAPVDKNIISKYSLPDPGRHFIIMSLGRLSKTAAHKGYDRLIKVFGSMAQKFPEARLVIGGKGDNRPYYESLARELNVADKTIFTGVVDEADLPGLYRCAHVFSLVSDRGEGRGEGIPLTPLEAMACGVAVIVGNHDGSQEAVVQNRNGSVIDPFDLQNHEQVLVELMNDQLLLEQKREAASLIARESFSYEGFKDKHQIFYRTLA